MPSGSDKPEAKVQSKRKSGGDPLADLWGGKKKRKSKVPDKIVPGGLTVEINLKSYSDRAKDIQKLNAEKGKLTSQKSSDELDIYFLKSFKRGSEAEEEIVTVSKEDRSQVNDLSASIIDLIKKNKFKSKNDLLSVLAATVNDVMEGKNKTKLSVVEDTEER